MPTPRALATPARVGVVIGTRPEAIKLAPVVTAMRAQPGLEPVVISTGQHREMLDQMLHLFGIAPEIDLGLMTAGQTLAGLTARLTDRLDSALSALDLDLLVVQGDTTTTMASALTAFYRRIPVAHVEAGLRTGNPYSPFPEEINRRITTQVAALHFAPTEATRANLLREGVDPATVHVTGNTVIDALFWAAATGAPFGDAQTPALERIEASDSRVLLVTAHRRESWDGGLSGIARALVMLVERHPELEIVFPIHRNPTVRAAVLPLVAGHERILVTEPLGYGGFVRLMQRADLVLSDSGGIQEEACSLGKPTLVTRDTTERPEAIEAGGTMLVGTDPLRIAAEITRLLSDEIAYQSMVCTTLPYGDGHSADRITRLLADFCRSTLTHDPAVAVVG
jgi:UDP-N-acetylglucosamine 2-epimerase (non-hydrolysing)